MTTRLRSMLIVSALAMLTLILTEPSHVAGNLLEQVSSLEPATTSLVSAAAPAAGISRSSRSGEIASGCETGYVPGRQITLNIRPCKGADGEFVSFRWPFRRYVLGSVNCGGSQVAIVQVEQQ